MMGQKLPFQQEMLEQLDIHMPKRNESRLSPYTFHKNES